MQTEFRPIPVTILDFLGVLLPGFVWLLLFSATYVFLIGPDELSLETVWLRVTGSVASAGPWLGPLGAVFASMLLGYAIKPIAMRTAESLSQFLLFLDRETRSFPKMRFPFDPYFQGKQYHTAVTRIVSKLMALREPELPGKPPFSSAKRYLKLAAPSLWEESERMEAEVRMLGCLFLAGVYNLALSLTVFFRCLIVDPSCSNEVAWLVWSTAATLTLGVGFNRLRRHEVEYTYMNVLIGHGFRAATEGEQDKEKFCGPVRTETKIESEELNQPKHG